MEQDYLYLLFDEIVSVGLGFVVVMRWYLLFVSVDLGSNKLSELVSSVQCVCISRLSELIPITTSGSLSSTLFSFSLGKLSLLLLLQRLHF